MSCCGQGRMALKTSQAATATAPARTWPGVQARAIPPPRAGVPLRYLGAGAAADQENLRPGAALRIPLPPGVDSTTLTRPDRETVTLKADATGVARYAATDRVGFYTVAPGVEGADRFAINLEDALESDIAPRSVELGGVPMTQGELIKTGTPEVWRWFVGAAVLVLLVEWWIYNRRVML